MPRGGQQPGLASAELLPVSNYPQPDEPAWRSCARSDPTAFLHRQRAGTGAGRLTESRISDAGAPLLRLARLHNDQRRPRFRRAQPPDARNHRTASSSSRETPRPSRYMIPRWPARGCVPARRSVGNHRDHHLATTVATCSEHARNDAVGLPGSTPAVSTVTAAAAVRARLRGPPHVHLGQPPPGRAAASRAAERRRCHHRRCARSSSTSASTATWSLTFWK